MKTPKRDSDIIDDIYEALTNEGPNPAYHREVMQRHEQEWPTLWKALRQILPKK